MSAVIDIADGVVAELNGHVFSPAFVAIREYVSKFELKDFNDLRVSVVPRSLLIAPATRDSDFYDVAVSILVRKRANSGEEAALDSLMDLTDAIVVFLKRLCFGGAAWVSIQNDPVYVADHLSNWNQFTSIIVSTYKLRK